MAGFISLKTFLNPLHWCACSKTETSGFFFSVVYIYVFGSFICFCVKCDFFAEIVQMVCWGVKWSPPPGAGFSSFGEDSLMALSCCFAIWSGSFLLTHSSLPFSIVLFWLVIIYIESTTHVNWIIRVLL